MDRRNWQAVVHGVTKQLDMSDYRTITHTHTHTHTYIYVELNHFAAQQKYDIVNQLYFNLKTSQYENKQSNLKFGKRYHQ